MVRVYTQEEVIGKLKRLEGLFRMHKTKKTYPSWNLVIAEVEAFIETVEQGK